MILAPLIRSIIACALLAGCGRLGAPSPAALGRNLHLYEGDGPNIETPGQISRTWHEASGVERDALKLLTPARLRFAISVPQGAKLELDLDTEGQALEIELLISGAAAPPRRRTLPERGLGWRTVTFDLRQLSGRPVELTLELRGKSSRIQELWLAEPQLAAGRTDGPPNLVLVVFDALRADHLGAYGYPRPTSPTLDRLADHGARFEIAVSPSPWTAPAMASLLSGLYPSEHGVMRIDPTRSWVQPLGAGRNLRPLDDPGLWDLARLLRRGGYRVLAVYGNPVARYALNSAPGRGFEALYNYSRYADQPEGTAFAVELALKALRGAPEPFFLLLHVMDPHTPYAPPAAAAQPFLDPDYAGELGLEFAGAASPWRQLTDPNDIQRSIDLYDGEIRNADLELRRLWRELDQTGRARRTLVAITSDHGEEFGGPDLHGHHLREHLLRVPLILRWPGRIGARRIATPVTTLDLPATLLDLLGAPARSALPGRSLAPLLRADRAAHRELLVSESLTSGPERRALRHGPWKLFSGPPFDLLVHLDRDPAERRNLAAADPQRLGRLRAALERWEEQLRPRPFGERGPLVTSREQLERLRALGYLR